MRFHQIQQVQDFSSFGLKMIPGSSYGIKLTGFSDPKTQISFFSNLLSGFSQLDIEITLNLDVIQIKGSQVQRVKLQKNKDKHQIGLNFTYFSSHNFHKCKFLYFLLVNLLVYNTCWYLRISL